MTDVASVLERVARVCYEVNRVWCATGGDDAQLPWADATPEQRQRIKQEVLRCLSGSTPAADGEVSAEQQTKDRLFRATVHAIMGPHE